MIKKLTCSIPSITASYEIEIGNSLLQDPRYLLQSLENLASRFAIITDEIVTPLYGSPLCRSLKKGGLDASLYIIPSGEKYKTREIKEQVENQLLEKKFGRDSCIIAIGGGVVTDLAGYLAATYCRGVPLVLIPTTLLGMVDASIGGKTGVNVPQGKNLIGTIYQPKKVMIDPSTLRTLPLSEIRNGIVEMIKHGLIADPYLFQFLEEHCDQLLNLEPSALEKVIFESCRIKKEIVESDEKDNGMRRLLNFGHTIGHALECLTKYALPHGEAVAIGLLVESRLALQMGRFNPHSFLRIHSLLEKYSIPLKLPFKLSVLSVLEAMNLDKKSLKGNPRFVIIDEIGLPLSYHSAYCTAVDEKLLINALQWMNNDLCCH